MRQHTCVSFFWASSKPSWGFRGALLEPSWAILGNCLDHLRAVLGLFEAVCIVMTLHVGSDDHHHYAYPSHAFRLSQWLSLLFKMPKGILTQFSCGNSQGYQHVSLHVGFDHHYHHYAYPSHAFPLSQWLSLLFKMPKGIFTQFSCGNSQGYPHSVCLHNIWGRRWYNSPNMLPSIGVLTWT